MSAADAFVLRTVQPMLAQGEAVLCMGWLEGSGRAERSGFLGAATTSRLIVIETGFSVLNSGPCEANLGVEVFDYAALSDVAVVSGEWRGYALRNIFALTRDGATQPRPYRIPAPIVMAGFVPSTQRDFHGFFAEWLARNVKAGAFRSAEGAQRALGEWQQKSAGEAAAQAQRALAKKRAAILWPFVLMVLALGGFAFNWVVNVQHGQRSVEHAQGEVARLEARLAAGQLRIDDRPYSEPISRQLPIARSSIAFFDEQLDKWMTVAGVAGGAAALMLALGVVLNVRKRARLRREGLALQAA